MGSIFVTALGGFPWMCKKCDGTRENTDNGVPQGHLWVLWTSCCCFLMLFRVFQGCGRHVVKHQRNIQGHPGGTLDFLLLLFSFSLFSIIMQEKWSSTGEN